MGLSHTRVEHPGSGIGVSDSLATELRRVLSSMEHLGQVRAVTFDVGGTLIAPWPSVGHVYSDVAARHGLRKLDIEKLNKQFAAAWESKTGFDYSRAAWAALVAKTFHPWIKPADEVQF